MLLGHGPTNTEETRNKLLAQKRFKYIYTIRDLCGIPSTNQSLLSRVTVLNCDTNSLNDVPFAQLGPYRNVFLASTPAQKKEARKKGWKLFAMLPFLPVYFSGLQALLFITQTHDAEEIAVLGLDFGAEYIEQTWKNTMEMSGGRTAASSPAELYAGVSKSLSMIKGVLEENDTILFTDSNDLKRHFINSIPVRDLIIEKISLDNNVPVPSEGAGVGERKGRRNAGDA